jgi:hypothetical protein
MPRVSIVQSLLEQRIRKKEGLTALIEGVDVRSGQLDIDKPV